MPERPARNHYSVAETVTEQFRRLGLVSKVVIDGMELPVCYAERFDAAEMIAQALNEQVVDERHDEFVTARSLEEAVEIAETRSSYQTSATEQDARQRIELLKDIDTRFKGAKIFRVARAIKELT